MKSYYLKIILTKLALLLDALQVSITQASFLTAGLFLPNTALLFLSLPTMEWIVRGSNHCGGDIFLTCPDRFLCPHNLLYNGSRVSFSGRGDDQLSLSSTEVEERVELYFFFFPLLPVWTFMDCSSVNVSFHLLSKLPQFVSRSSSS